jgi:hypothetical protein
MLLIKQLAYIFLKHAVPLAPPLFPKYKKALKILTGRNAIAYSVAEGVTKK